MSYVTDGEVTPVMKDLTQVPHFSDANIHSDATATVLNHVRFYDDLVLEAYIAPRKSTDYEFRAFGTNANYSVVQEVRGRCCRMMC